MRIETIDLTDFYGYREASIDLRGIATLAVTGKVGAGKSTLPEAITWALYGRSRQPDEALIREDAPRTEVSIGLAARGHDVRVTRSKERGRSAVLTLEVDGQDRTRHTIAETEAAIVDLVGLSYEALIAGPFQRQMMDGQPSGGLLDRPPAERKELLGELFGLGEYVRYAAEAKGRRTAAEAQAKAAAEALERLDPILAAEAEMREAAATIDARVDQLTQEDQAYADQLAELRTALATEARIDQHSRNLATERTGLEARLRRVRASIADERAKVERAREVLSAEQPPEPATDPDPIEDCRIRIDYTARLGAWKGQHNAALATIRDGEVRLAAVAESGRPDLARYRAVVDELAGIGEADVAGAESKVAAAETGHRGIRQALREATERKGSLAGGLARMDMAREERDRAAEVAESAGQAADTHRQLERAFGRDGVPLLILEAGIPAIEARANATLEKLGSFQLRLVTQTATATGKLRDVLEVEVQRGGRVRGYAGLSGGQRFQVGLALRLGLAEVLATRTGARIGTLVIDEGFGSQDPEAIETLIGAVAALRDDFALIIVISHHEAISETMDAEARATMIDDVSELRLVG